MASQLAEDFRVSRGWSFRVGVKTL
jgi:hypothetical protein